MKTIEQKGMHLNAEASAILTGIIASCVFGAPELVLVGAAIGFGGFAWESLSKKRQAKH